MIDATQLIDVKGTSFAYREFGAPSTIPLAFVLSDKDHAALLQAAHNPLTTRVPRARVHAPALFP